MASQWLVQLLLALHHLRLTATAWLTALYTVVVPNTQAADKSSSAPSLPTASTLLNAVGQLVGPSALQRLPAVRSSLDLSEEGLLLSASRQAGGLTDLGPADDGHLPSLRCLLSSLQSSPHLSLLGRLLAHEALTLNLSNRLLLQSTVRLHGEAVRQQRIERPVFVLGFPRTGTTHLFNLLAQDHEHFRPLLFYEATEPALSEAEYRRFQALKQRGTVEDDPRIARCRQSDTALQLPFLSLVLAQPPSPILSAPHCVQAQWSGVHARSEQPGSCACVQCRRA